MSIHLCSHDGVILLLPCFVNAVGISVKQKDIEQELVYNKEDLLNPYFLCQ